MKQSLQLKLGQQLTMTPQLQQAIRLLQLSTLDLQTEIQEALETESNIVAAACPFCNTMLTDGVKQKEKEEAVKVLDVAELVAASMNQ